MAKYGEYDSKEELWFEWYLDELYELGLIKSYYYHPPSFELSLPVSYKLEERKKTKTNILTREFLKSHDYQLDFKIIWDYVALGKLFNIIGETVKQKAYFWAARDDNDFISYVDVKGAFAAKNNNSATTFPLNQKWLWDKYGIYVQKVMVSNKRNSVFAKTFTPEKFLTTEKTGQDRMIHYKPILTINKFLEL